MVRVFLSHSSQDKPFVRMLADELETGGEIKVWLDEGGGSLRLREFTGRLSWQANG
jgi:hypothetical protein